ncbi:MAG: Spy/CpxP family protein refolding chaperone [Desulfarculaceae bacterium]|jgi:Spy/CpxP family protein refolding chaperone
MINKKKCWVLGAIVVLVALVLTGWAMAKNYPGSCFKKGPDCVLSRMDERVKELALSPKQQKKYEALRTEIKEQIQKRMQAQEKFLGQVKDQLYKDDPDLKTINNAVKQKLQEMSAVVGEGMDRFLEFYELLDPEQKQKVIDKIRDRIDTFSKYGPRWHLEAES